MAISRPRKVKVGFSFALGSQPLEETNGKEENNGSSRLASCCSEGEIQCESEMKSESEVDLTWNGN